MGTRGEVAEQLPRRGEAAWEVFLEAVADEGVDLMGKAGTHLAGPRWTIVEMLVQNGEAIAAIEGRAAGEHFVQSDAE
jgi:hypothetical protein